MLNLFKRHPMVKRTFQMEGAQWGSRYRWTDTSNHMETSRAMALEYFRDRFNEHGLVVTRMTIINS